VVLIKEMYLSVVKLTH